MPYQKHKLVKWGLNLFAILLVACVHRDNLASGGQFLIDFGILQGPADGWDAFDSFQEDNFARLIDRSGGGDDDVTITALDHDFAANDVTPPGMASEYDGVIVPTEANGDYFYRDNDVAGTSARFRIDGIDSGYYDVTVFEGRTSDGNGQFGEIWASDKDGNSPSNVVKTANFAASHSIIEVFIGVGESLWYKHLEDGIGGVSGMIINPRSPQGRLPLEAGDADQDFDFDQIDLVQVQVAAKYLTGQAATWGDGDWNGAPGGTVGIPPLGDGVFDQLDIVAALDASRYLTGPYDFMADTLAVVSHSGGPFMSQDVVLPSSANIAVPEPSPLMLLITPVLGLAFARRGFA